MTSEKSLLIRAKSASLISRLVSKPVPLFMVMVLESVSPVRVAVVVPDEPVDDKAVPKVIESEERNTFPPLASMSTPEKSINSEVPEASIETPVVSRFASTLISLPSMVRAPIRVAPPIALLMVKFAVPESIERVWLPAEVASIVSAIVIA